MEGDSGIKEGREGGIEEERREGGRGKEGREEAL